jgi:hypothetical protein
LNADHFASASFAFNLGFGGGAKSMGANRQFLGQVPVSEDFDAIGWPIGQAGFTQGFDVDARSLVELIEGFQIDRDIAGGVAGIVKAAFGDAADQGHLAAFEADADRASRAGGLAFAAAPAGLAMSAGLTLAKPFAPVLGAGPGFEIV